MTNCFFVALRKAFKHDDFAHFPLDDQTPKCVFKPYFHNLESFVELLYHLADFQQHMYGYTKQSTYKNNKATLHFAVNHVLVGNERVDDQDLGEFLHKVVSKDVKLKDWLAHGYYDGGSTVDHLLVLLCEFSGIEIHVHVASFTQTLHFPKENRKETKTIPARCIVYKRLNTQVRTQIHLNLTKGHAEFKERKDLPLKSKKRKRIS